MFMATESVSSCVSWKPRVWMMELETVLTW
jgi:hypothetical protein